MTAIGYFHVTQLNLFQYPPPPAKESALAPPTLDDAHPTHQAHPSRSHKLSNLPIVSTTPPPASPTSPITPEPSSHMGKHSNGYQLQYTSYAHSPWPCWCLVHVVWAFPRDSQTETAVFCKYQQRMDPYQWCHTVHTDCSRNKCLNQLFTHHCRAYIHTTIIHLYRGMLACRLKVEPDVLNAQKIWHYWENLCFETIHFILHNVHSQDDGQMQIQQRELLLGLQLPLYWDATALVSHASIVKWFVCLFLMSSSGLLLLQSVYCSCHLS